ncbi:2-dehydro-3-deoxyphosphogluconate aldolase/(4S)-4-hydroxy-2-oxoglutarate aldolase [Roseivirga pacifica]|uniref:2-dehydro-3-deoxyphosphogluconate aldolase / (4S)-4-hydroxy-2-oxoglutarate aldolase n=1 Tax=Roseivirga pacifica TaxID=1267423 RepID=A0A1I0M958_9BACT|nr:bifunctional 4-hydroxy-2-oxoglutarate aldolase/2-dehydro-3-deoxy-phosphogluconate aldolase [Roseivirga pacifica]RKQ50200.1 2-dehydro-3-deoxyphosphogluconate aldolase/(4S)-4-hydroxy-2-oxoglutarate aldolase [Roseivirga pacifica]SEV85005.1 2-dehydro-3-deoxyphosphogluconate aldolase / (4S)-4-hydroxy-2-oxoglutarate aldolase [Roseivirga pacifica]
MARFTRIEVAQQMHQTGIVPVYYNEDLKTCKEVLKASYAAGVRVFEFTNRGDQAHEIFSELYKLCKTELPEMMLGVGSIVDGATAALYLQLGADLIVSPVLNHEIAKVCNRRKVLWAAGCGTLSEINQAEEWGAEIVKLFPAQESGGASFIKSIAGPCPWTCIMPTGGVEPTHESLKEWFGAGAYCVGMGSKLMDKKLIANQEFTKLTEFIQVALNLTRTVRMG